MLTILLGLLALILPVGFALGVYFLIHLHNEEILDRRANRYRNRTTYNYDANGNPQFIYNPETEALIIPPSGNPAYAPTIMIRDSVQRNIKSDPAQAVLYNISRKTESLNDGKTIEDIEKEAETSETSTDLKLPNSEGETLKYIDKCIEEGVAMTRAARAIGINPGENKPYLAFKSLWSTRVARKDISPLS